MVAAGGRRCVRCDCRLSRYNQGDLCSACVRASPSSVPVAPSVSERVWRDPEVQSALAAWDFGPRFGRRILRR
jgi:hypothetical protein